MTNPAKNKTIKFKVCDLRDRSINNTVVILVHLNMLYYYLIFAVLKYIK